MLPPTPFFGPNAQKFPEFPLYSLRLSLDGQKSLKSKTLVDSNPRLTTFPRVPSVCEWAGADHPRSLIGRAAPSPPSYWSAGHIPVVSLAGGGRANCPLADSNYLANILPPLLAFPAPPPLLCVTVRH